MGKSDRVENEDLVKAGLEMMRRAGKPLTKLPTKGRSMQYQMENGETVRLRTCNDHVLIVVADTPENDANLNVEGTDWLLIAMPEIERTPGRLIAYLVPATEAAAEARRAHREWLKTNPDTQGGNRTWNLWFRPHTRDGSSNYAERWAKYRLPIYDPGEIAVSPVPRSEPNSIKEEVEAARRRIAAVAGVPVAAVRISIDFGV
jgi:hypothetical protein